MGEGRQVDFVQQRPKGVRVTPGMAHGEGSDGGAMVHSPRGHLGGRKAGRSLVPCEGNPPNHPREAAVTKSTSAVRGEGPPRPNATARNLPKNKCAAMTRTEGGQVGSKGASHTAGHTWTHAQIHGHAIRHAHHTDTQTHITDTHVHTQTHTLGHTTDTPRYIYTHFQTQTRRRDNTHSYRYTHGYTLSHKQTHPHSSRDIPTHTCIHTHTQIHNSHTLLTNESQEPPMGPEAELNVGPLGLRTPQPRAGRTPQTEQGAAGMGRTPQPGVPPLTRCQLLPPSHPVRACVHACVRGVHSCV